MKVISLYLYFVKENAEILEKNILKREAIFLNYRANVCWQSNTIEIVQKKYANWP